jgi:hypothetical protein
MTRKNGLKISGNQITNGLTVVVYGPEFTGWRRRPGLMAQMRQISRVSFVLFDRKTSGEFLGKDLYGTSVVIIQVTANKYEAAGKSPAVRKTFF